MDGLGSVVAITGPVNGQTKIVQYAVFDAFGELMSGSGSYSEAFLYTGEPRISETGYDYLRARYYDSKIGRFLSRDPVAGSTRNPLSLNRYSYVENNPVNAVDPSGKWVSVLLTVATVAALYLETPAMLGEATRGKAEQGYDTDFSYLARKAVDAVANETMGKIAKPIARRLYHPGSLGRPPVFPSRAYWFGLRSQLETVEGGVEKAMEWTGKLIGEWYEGVNTSSVRKQLKK